MKTEQETIAIEIPFESTTVDDPNSVYGAATVVTRVRQAR